MLAELMKTNDMILKRSISILLLFSCSILIQICLLVINRKISSVLSATTSVVPPPLGVLVITANNKPTNKNTANVEGAPIFAAQTSPSKPKLSSAYNASGDINTRPQQKVYVLPQYYPKSKQSEHKHFILDGIEQSQKLELTNDPLDPEAIWAVNAGRYSCESFQNEFRNRIENLTLEEATSGTTSSDDANIESKRTTTNQSSLASLLSSSQQRSLRGSSDIHQYNDSSSSLKWSIIIMDWSDRGVLIENYKPCLENIYHAFGSSNENTFVATRTVLWGRNVFIEESQTRVEYGEPIDYNRELSTTSTVQQQPEVVHSTDRKMEEKTNEQQGQMQVPLFAGYVQPIRFGVRSDLVNKIDAMLKNVGEVDVVNKVRSGDAIHFWSIGSGKNWHGRFRSAVSQAMRDFAAEEKIINKEQEGAMSRKWNITTAEIGARKKAGRNSVTDEYADALLNYKIVVVAQRDEWEGHYRFMEALAGGALVLTDPMHPLPCGIEDGLHVVVYNNMAELKYYLKYYLEHDNERLTIAKKGYQAAMSNHRSWNRMEKMVFGDWSKFYFDC